jgi:hypothetical protein
MSPWLSWQALARRKQQHKFLAARRNTAETMYMLVYPALGCSIATMHIHA